MTTLTVRDTIASLSKTLTVQDHNYPEPAFQYDAFQSTAFYTDISGYKPIDKQTLQVRTTQSARTLIVE